MCRKFMLKMFDSKNAVIAFPSSGYEAIIEHTHDFVELVYILNGSLLHCIRGQRIPLVKGDLFVIATPDPHSMVPVDPPEDCQWMNCIIDSQLLGESFGDLDPTQHINFSLHPDVGFLINAMAEEYKNQNLYFQDILLSYFSALLHKFRRACQIYDYANHFNGQTQKSLYIDQVVDYIQHHFQEKIKLEDLSKAVGISIGYMDKIFREERSTTPIEYLNICRVSNACVQLVSTDRPIAEICENVGFHDIKFFYTMFKRQNGISPGAYRKMNRKS